MRDVTVYQLKHDRRQVTKDFERKKKSTEQMKCIENEISNRSWQLASKELVGFVLFLFKPGGTV
jgi:hypothetical protein